MNKTAAAKKSAQKSARKPTAVNQITRKSRQIYPVLNGDTVPLPDLSVHRSQRPMCGLDLEEWRGLLKLSKFDAESALGFRSASLYNREAARKVLPVRTEILVRLYDEKPENYPWTRLTFKELFAMMYGKQVDLFDGEMQARARNDLEARFTVLFGRSPTRGYAWLRGDESQGDERSHGGNKASSYATIERILQKLTQWDDPGAVFERVAMRCLQMRGVDIDQIFPVPTLERPPERGRPGRKPSPEGPLRGRAARKAAESASALGAEATKPAAKKAAAKKPATKKPAVKKATAKKAAVKSVPPKKKTATAKKAAPRKAARSNRARAHE